MTVYRRKNSWHPHLKPIQVLRWHWESPKKPPGKSACGNVLIAETEAGDPGAVDPDKRCFSSGCRHLWEKWSK
jgi:hypothetical protein